MPLKWTFREKQLDDIGKRFIFKPHYVLRGDFEEEGIEFDSNELYAPVASYELIRLLLCISAKEALDSKDVT